MFTRAAARRVKCGNHVLRVLRVWFSGITLSRRVSGACLFDHNAH